MKKLNNADLSLVEVKYNTNWISITQASKVDGTLSQVGIDVNKDHALILWRGTTSGQQQVIWAFLSWALQVDKFKLKGMLGTGIIVLTCLGC